MVPKILKKNLTFAIVAHIYASGPSQKLENYLIKKADDLIFIGHPFSYAPDTRSFLRIYKKGKLVADKKFLTWRGPEISFYFKDILLTLWWLIRYKPIDYFVGVDNLNAFTGFILKRLSRVSKIIFYTIDYIPHRFENKFLNAIYHWVDKFMVVKSDKVWNLSKIMVEKREINGVNKQFRDKQLVVPMGCDINDSIVLQNKIDRYKIVFMGHLRQGHGIEMLITAMTTVIKKIPKASLLIIGGGALEDKLKVQAKRLKLTSSITFSGFIEKFNDVNNLLRSSAIAIAPYEDNNKTFTRYTDPGKVKDYLACGLPVIITKVPQVAWEIDKNKCGLAINYNQEELSKAIITLLKNKNLLGLCRKNALKMAKKYTWDKIFNKALSQII